MKDKDKDKDKNTNTNSNENNNEDNKTYAELLEELSSLNISISLLCIVIISLVISLTFTYNEKAKALDKINNTNFADYSTTFDNRLRFSRRLDLFVATVSVINNYKRLQVLLSSNPIDQKAVSDAKKSIFASILLFFSAKISHDIIFFEEE